MKSSLLSFTLEELRELLNKNSFAKYAADQIYNWVYKKQNLDMSAWSNVSKKIKTYFSSNFDQILPTIEKTLSSSDGTTKFLMRMNDGHSIETVIIPSKGRLTLCVSTQIGCAIGCYFCNTGTMKFIRNLEVHEIIGQYMTASLWYQREVDQSAVLSKVVFMGQGEPLHNFDNTKKAIQILMEPKGLGIGQRKITVSTAGLVPQLKRLDDFPPVNIAISLHASSNEIRDKLMPINQVHNIEQLFDALKLVPLKPNRAVTFEYLLISNLNDRKEDIDGLCQLLDKKTAKINIIPFNEFEGSNFHRPSEERIVWFKNQLLARGYVCTVRVSKGQEIMAACGQLKSSND